VFAQGRRGNHFSEEFRFDRKIRRENPLPDKVSDKFGILAKLS
jgi:hypothetical protein